MDPNLKAVEARNRKSENKKKIPTEVSISEAAAKIDPSGLAAFMANPPDPYPDVPKYRLMRFVDYYGDVFSDVSCPWHVMFKKSNLSKILDQIDVPFSSIPESFYKTSMDWLTQQVPNKVLAGLVTWAFSCIISDVSRGAAPCWKGVENPTRMSPVAMFVALPMVLHSKPHLLSMALPDLRRLRKWHKYDDRIVIPLTVWMIAQASLLSISENNHLYVGLQAWAHNLLPIFGSKPQLRHLILNLVEKILAQPDAQAKLIDDPVWEDNTLIPPDSFEILLRLTFPDSSAKVTATSRFEVIYPSLKKMALAGAAVFEDVAKEMFTFSMRLLAGEGNPVLAKEATEIAIWSLIKDTDCWKHWYNLYYKNLEASVALLKNLVENWKEYSPKLASSSKEMKHVIQHIFTLSWELAGEGNPVLAKEATEIAIWSLIEDSDCWEHWYDLYEEKCWYNFCKENLGASVAILKNLVENWKEYTPKLASSSKEMKHVIQHIFTLSLKLAGEGNPVLAKEATSIAIWSLAENVVCWKCWDYLFEKNLEASVALLKKLVDEWKDHSRKLSSSPSDTVTISQTMKRLKVKNKKAITEIEANGSLYKEADKFCKTILWRLSLGSYSLNKCTAITAAVLVATGVAGALVLSSATELKNLVYS